MRKMTAAFCSVMVAACLVTKLSRAADEAAKKADEQPAAATETKEAATEQPAAETKGEAKESLEVIPFDKTGKMPPVAFKHKFHQEKLKGCKDCHEGEKPLFPQKKTDAGMKMADMYAGKACGSCHNGKKAFAAKSACMKCHKKEKAAK